MNRGTTLLAALAAAVIVGTGISSAKAGDFQFNPYGNGTGAGLVTAGGLEPGAGNILAQNAVNTVTGAPAAVGSLIPVYYQATLAAYLNTGGTTIAPAGLNTTFQITVQSKIMEVVTSVDLLSGTDTFALAANQTGSFINIYQNNAVTANSLAGTGYSDGSLILQAIPDATAANGTVFTVPLVNGVPTIQNFDQFGSNDYVGVQSLVGFGGATLSGNVVSFDPNFFPTPPSLLTIDFNTSDITPFKQTNPGHLVVGQIPNIGSVNGASGPDFQFQGDATVSVTATPEPSSMAILGLGAVGLLRRRRKTA